VRRRTAAFPLAELDMRPSTFDPARAGLFSSRRGAMSCLAALVLCTQGAFASPPQGAAQRRAGAVAEPSAATRDVPGVSASHASDARSPALTLEEAVALAVDDAPSLAARRAGRRAAEARVAPSEALPDPELMFGLDNLPITGTDAGRFDEMTMRRVGVMQAFPRKAKRAARGALARAVVERRRSELASERSSVRERAALAWIDASLATAKLERLQDLGPILDAQVAAADAAIAAGRGMVADAISARSVRAALRQRAFDAEADAARARARLARWLPHDWDRALAPPPDTAVQRRTEADVLGAVTRHRELAAYDARVREASAELELVRQDKRPDWSLELSYGDRDPAFSDMVSVGVRIDLPIFAARRQDPLIAAKRAAIARWSTSCAFGP
jgi:cobalt-zinc-cadmium efflux system outer membrane protein